MEVRRVDPRDAAWQLLSPRYRVYFQRRRAAPEGCCGAYESDEYEISEAADVLEVLAWAEKTAADNQTYVVYALVDSDPSSLGLVRVAGMEN